MITKILNDIYNFNEENNYYYYPCLLQVFYENELNDFTVMMQCYGSYTPIKILTSQVYEPMYFKDLFENEINKEVIELWKQLN